MDSGWHGLPESPRAGRGLIQTTHVSTLIKYHGQTRRLVGPCHPDVDISCVAAISHCSLLVGLSESREFRPAPSNAVINVAHSLSMALNANTYATLG
jgi:hypothetical protein